MSDDFDKSEPDDQEGIVRHGSIDSADATAWSQSEFQDKYPDYLPLVFGLIKTAIDNGKFFVTFEHETVGNTRMKKPKWHEALRYFRSLGYRTTRKTYKSTHNLLTIDWVGDWK